MRIIFAAIDIPLKHLRDVKRTLRLLPPVAPVRRAQEPCPLRVPVQAAEVFYAALADGAARGRGLSRGGKLRVLGMTAQRDTLRRKVDQVPLLLIVDAPLQF